MCLAFSETVYKVQMGVNIATYPFCGYGLMIFPGDPPVDGILSEESEISSASLMSIIADRGPLDSKVSYPDDACAQALDLGSRLLSESMKCPPNSPGQASLNIFIPRLDKRLGRSQLDSSPLLQPDDSETSAYHPRVVPSVFMHKREARNAIIIEDEFLSRLGEPNQSELLRSNLPIVRKIYRIN